MLTLVALAVYFGIRTPDGNEEVNEKTKGISAHRKVVYVKAGTKL
jgi:hypothetical protein